MAVRFSGTRKPRSCSVGAESAVSHTTVAVTDHDTVDHNGPSADAGARLGIHVVPGIELSVAHGGKSYHLLGYRIDPECTELREEIERQQRARRDRIMAMADKLRAIGWTVNLGDALEKHGSVGRPMLAQIVYMDESNRERCAREGIGDHSQFLDSYLTRGAAAWMDRYRTTMQRGSSWSTPPPVLPCGHIRYGTRATNRKRSNRRRELVSFGLDGVEVFYGTHRREDVERLSTLARKHDIIPTAGSDFHAPDRSGFPDVGGWPDYGIPWSPDSRLI